MSHYDFIIIGAGASGLLLADALGSDDFFKSKSILLIDKEDKTKNDRTWCFWEVGEGKFDHLVHKKWPKIYFAGEKLKLSTDINPYSYKMVRGIDFYQHYREKIQNHSNITWLRDSVTHIVQQSSKAQVNTELGSYRADLVFNSIFSYDSIHQQKKYPVLQQHFVGWFVKTEKPVFNSEEATFMDFSIPQKGNTRFMYVLPFSETEALFEYTLFSEKLLDRKAYERAIQEYLNENYKDISYSIIDTEQGSIPMTCYPFNENNTSSIISIGIAGGWAKPSTGFTFYATNKRVGELVDRLKQGRSRLSLNKKDKFWFYDLIMLDVLAHDNHLGQSIFESLFRKRKVPLILKFLDNETNFWEDILIMSAPKPIPFIKALFRRIF
ncbi:lycopene cyclase family protein [Flagellimonas allohymeniacidonis]|uniref:Lycopene cyclase n=1 Tax=Flagellimonas allohymeniacidonis TaxID=2517819 RepID=A0A4Q8QCZ3_9FLAO|nr:lycopene cyclase family protein [Allomuricauda hymeniacidonis]TAI47367.1 lycopene cyclase [Allomuricauda hymeniacidonis]